MKQDEIDFLRLLRARCSFIDRDGVKHKESPREIINSEGFPIHHKRAWFILRKICRRGWYDYGVTLDLGCLTEKGVQEIDVIIE